MKYISFFFVLVILGCKKENPIPPPTPPPAADSIPLCDPVITANYSYDTIYPSDYLMAYPGSWWEYDDGFIDSCTSWQEVLIHSTTTVDNCKFVDEDLWILPEKLMYHGGHNIAYDLSVNTPADYSSTTFGKIYDTIPGIMSSGTSNGGEGAYAYEANSVTEMLPKLDSFIVNGTTYYDVLHKKSTVHMYYYHQGGGPTYYTEYYFAKGVGLVMRIFSSNVGNYTEYKLIDHYIAPH